jgi:hypothetical protein
LKNECIGFVFAFPFPAGELVCEAGTEVRFLDSGDFCALRFPLASSFTLGDAVKSREVDPARANAASMLPVAFLGVVVGLSSVSDDRITRLPLVRGMAIVGLIHFESMCMLKMLSLVISSIRRPPPTRVAELVTSDFLTIPEMERQENIVAEQSLKMRDTGGDSTTCKWKKDV